MTILAIHKQWGPVVIGQRIVGCTDGNCDWYEQPLVLLSETTRAAWLAFCLQETGEAPAETEYLDGCRFFRVSMD